MEVAGDTWLTVTPPSALIRITRRAIIHDPCRLLLESVQPRVPLPPRSLSHIKEPGRPARIAVTHISLRATVPQPAPSILAPHAVRANARVAPHGGPRR